ncbi:MAG: transcription-repair coupling factor [Alphaproteobacteria bacterium]|nr:transcription-repair coupling factor [Alphaproteobacteria bacterium]
MSDIFSVDSIPESPAKAVLLRHVPAGGVAKVLADLLRDSQEQTMVYIAAHLADAHSLRNAVRFFSDTRLALDIDIFPAWNCAPYDRSSPEDAIQAERARLLYQFSRQKNDQKHLIIIPVNAFLHYVPPPEHYRALNALQLEVGSKISPENLTRCLVDLGFHAADMVHHPGEFVQRGGLIDVFAPGQELPIRLDFFGDELESLTYFDPLTQRRLTDHCQNLAIMPSREVILNSETVQCFRQGYREAFGLGGAQDSLFAAISAQQPYRGMEHWQALFYGKMGFISAYFDNPLYVFGKGSLQGGQDKLNEIQAYYSMRYNHYADLSKRNNSIKRDEVLSEAYKPLAPEYLYPDAEAFARELRRLRILSFEPFEEFASDAQQDLEYPISAIENFVAARALNGEAGVLEVLKLRAGNQWKGKVKIVATAHREKQTRALLKEGGFKLLTIQTFNEAKRHAPDTIYIINSFNRAGFETPKQVFLGEVELLGGEETQRVRRSRQAKNMILDMITINAGDLVTHIEHGIGRYLGLSSISAEGIVHECIKIEYAEGGILHLPVENIELVSLYGESDAEGRVLDRLGHIGWQTRKARVRGRIKDISQSLISLAAKRHSVQLNSIEPDWDQYASFKQNIAFGLTEDQQGAIDDLIDDLGRNYPMDRLICGDVGFGKTEIAMHAIFVAAYAGGQVALLAPTTLLAAQHYRILKKRLQGFGFEIALRSRVNKPSEVTDILSKLSEGGLDIVVGTHALLGKKVKFKNLKLLVIDEEQRFGVSQKEYLKNLRTEIHVLSLSATPIPRTLNMALSGVRDLSVIATPPVDRLAIRTILEPFDEVSIEHALMREKDRNGQSYFVTPRIKYIAELETLLAKITPELEVATVHGRMKQDTLDDEMRRFVEGEADVLLATSIIESGLDVTNANTMIVHRPDLFGLSQLYQIRGRIGRGAVRANCYLCLPKRGEIHQNAAQRLEILQTLDTLGAGFTLAHHDMDLRGVGNLVGSEQSGHINEVGIELYQRMLSDALEALRNGEDRSETELIAKDARHNIEINLGLSVGIPEDYIHDLSTRLSLYRRIARLENDAEIQAVSEEFRDRFGPIPETTLNLLSIISIKALAKTLRVQKIDAGPQGVAVKFFEDHFRDGMICLMLQYPKDFRASKDQRLIYSAGNWARSDQRIPLTLKLLHHLQTMKA